LIPSKNVRHDNDSNYTKLPVNGSGDYTLVDDDTDQSANHEMHADDSVLVSVPIMFKRDDDTGTITDTAESIYNQNCSVPCPTINVKLFR
jgi:hypothetical protein